jgi:hypothetical protein
LAQEIKNDVKDTIQTLDQITDKKIARMAGDPVFSQAVQLGKTDAETSYQSTRTKSNGTTTGPWNLSAMASEVSLKRAFLSQYKSDHTSHEMGATEEEKHTNKALRGLVKDSFQIRDNLFKLLGIRKDIKSLSDDGSNFPYKNKQSSKNEQLSKNEQSSKNEQLSKNEQSSKNEQLSKNEQSLLDDFADITQNMPSNMDPED